MQRPGDSEPQRELLEGTGSRDRMGPEEGSLARSHLASFRAAVDKQAIIAVTDRAGRITEINDKFVEISGYSREELLGQDHRILNSGRHPKSLFVDMWRVIANGGIWRGEICNRAKDGREYWVDSSIGPIRDVSDEISGYIAVRFEITRQKLIQEQLYRAANFDELTGLYNRAALTQRLGEACKSDRDHAVLYLDFDRFKMINDSLGHDVGDATLRAIAARLRESVERYASQAAEATVARIGGDEFVILLSWDRDPAMAVTLAEGVLAEFAKPLRVENREFFLTASIGITTRNDHGAAVPDEMLRRADTAMYGAKTSGGGRYALYHSEMSNQVRSRLRMEHDLHLALGAGQLFLEYQPIIALESGEVDGLEALVRWDHPELGLLPPSLFIPIAEQSGLAPAVGEVVLREACRQLAEWRRSMGADAPGSVNINLSRAQLHQPDLVDRFERAIRETGVPPGSLRTEITESAVMQDPEAGTRLLRGLRELGIHQCLDDFGTGHSSLGSLHELPIDTLKLDRSFITPLDGHRGFAAIVHATIQLASNLDLRVVAEGIETSDQLVTLQAMGCEFGQGFLFSRSLPAAAVPAFIASRKGGRSRAA